jgi:hypothetical protein
MRSSPEEKKRRLLADLSVARRQLLDTAAGVSPEQAKIRFPGKWSLEDLPAHLIGWDYTNLAATKAVLAGQLPDFYAHHDRDWRSYNALLVEQYKHGDVRTLSAAAQASHAQLVSYLEGVEAVEFERDHGVRFRGYRVTIVQLPQAETGDELEHERQIVAGFVVRKTD